MGTKQLSVAEIGWFDIIKITSVHTVAAGHRYDF